MQIYHLFYLISSLTLLLPKNYFDLKSKGEQKNVTSSFFIIQKSQRFMFGLRGNEIANT